MPGRRRRRQTTTTSNPFRSKFEGKVAAALSEAGVDWEYEPTRFLYTITRRYTPDFYLPAVSVYVEVKGYFTSEDRSKLLQVKRDNPDIDLRLVFQQPNNRLNKRSKTTYAEWADQHEFQWAEGKVPDAWIKG